MKLTQKYSSQAWDSGKEITALPSMTMMTMMRGIQKRAHLKGEKRRKIIIFCQFCFVSLLRADLILFCSLFYFFCVRCYQQMIYRILKQVCHFTGMSEEICCIPFSIQCVCVSFPLLSGLLLNLLSHCVDLCTWKRKEGIHNFSYCLAALLFKLFSFLFSSCSFSLPCFIIEKNWMRFIHIGKKIWSWLSWLIWRDLSAFWGCWKFASIF